MASEGKANAWIAFIGLILLLIGIYGSVRTGINIMLFQKYPQDGVLNLSIGQPYYSPQREQDCMYPQTYYQADGRTTRAPTNEEKAAEKVSQKNCVDGIKESREHAKVNDISQSLLFLFLGIGVLSARKIFFS